MVGILLKNTISIKGRCSTFFINTATNAKVIEEMSMKKIPVL